MGFNHIFWGLLFLFDFRIQGWDILPDVIGYILMFLGLSLLSHQNDYFRIAKLISIPMIVISIFDIYQLNQNQGGFHITYSGTAILSLILFIINLIFVHHLCYGVKEMADRKNNYSLSEHAEHRWKLYLYVQIAFAVVFIIVFLIPPLAFILIILLLILMLVTLLKLMGLMRMAENDFGRFTL